MINEDEAYEIKYKIEGLQTFIKEYAEMHKEDINANSFGAFVITLKSQLNDIEDMLI